MRNVDFPYHLLYFIFLSTLNFVNTMRHAIVDLLALVCAVIFYRDEGACDKFAEEAEI